VIGAQSGVGLTNGTYNSTSLLDNIVTAGGTSGTSTLTVAVNGGTTQTITFGTGAGKVSTDETPHWPTSPTSPPASTARRRASWWRHPRSRTT
jgi:hypothetical protein